MYVYTNLIQSEEVYFYIYEIILDMPFVVSLNISNTESAFH